MSYLNTNLDLYGQVKKAEQECHMLSEEAQRGVRNLRVDFERGGIHLCPEKLDRVNKLNIEICQLCREYMASRKRRAVPTPGEASNWDTSRFTSEIAWHRYQDNIQLRNILPERNVELGPGMFDEFLQELRRRRWDQVLTHLPEKRIDVALVKEFYSNLYDPEDHSPRFCRVRGQVVRFDTDTINDFLDTPVILEDGEEYTAYTRYLSTHPDPDTIAATLCTPGGRFVLNADGLPWKLLRKDMTTLAQTWSVLSYYDLAPTSHTSDVNLDRARLIYGLVSRMDMDVGSFISQQISQIAQSSTSRLGFPALITALCDIQGVVSDTLIFESLSPAINLAYVKKNCWNPADPSITFPGPRRTRTRASASASEAPLPTQSPSQPSQRPRHPPASTSASMDMHGQMLRSLHVGQQLIMENMHRLSLHLQMDPPLTTPEAYRTVDIYPSSRIPKNLHYLVKPIYSSKSLITKDLSGSRGTLKEKGFRITTDPQTLTSVLQFSSDDEVRKIVYIRGNSVPHANVDVLKRLISARHELAQIMGCRSYAEFSVKPNISVSPKVVTSFLLEMSKMVQAKCIEERKLVMKFKREKCSQSDGDLRPWHETYYMTMMASSAYKLNSSGDLGYLYLDLYSREGKYPGCAHFAIKRTRRISQTEYQLPIVVLVFNLSGAWNSSAVSLSHWEVETLFHEFGHALQSLLSRTDYQHFSGTRTVLDFAEIPSNLFEHCSTGEEIPQKLVKSMQGARDMFAATDLQRQIFYALVGEQPFPHTPGNSVPRQHV
ncbi:Mitochondrial intermediate peptidase, mitochondrial [Glycine soja]